MKYGKIVFKNWEYVNPHDWSRYGYDDTELVPYFSVARIELIKHYNTIGSEGFWIPRFMHGIDHLQTIYDTTTDYKKFKWNEEEKAKKYVDEFLIHMNKLIVFL